MLLNNHTFLIDSIDDKESLFSYLRENENNGKQNKVRT